MNYYDARKRQDTEKYDYTRMNDGHISPVGFCAERTLCDCATFESSFRPKDDCEVCGGKGRVPNPDYCGSHDTEEEARACFRRYLLSEPEEIDYSGWEGCQAMVDGKKCDEPTKHGMRGMRSPLAAEFALCDEHRTAEVLEALTPEIHQITASY